MLIEIMLLAALAQEAQPAGDETKAPAADAPSPATPAKQPPTPKPELSRLSDDEVKAAIAAAGSAKGCVNEGILGNSDKPGISACTPFGNIAQSAKSAKAEFRKLDPASVKDWVRTYFTVFAYPPDRFDASTKTIKRIVLREPGKEDVVEPVWERSDPKQHGNAAGGQVTLTSNYACFAMEDVVRLLAADPKGQLVIAVATNRGPVEFKVKAKDLGLVPPAKK
jgi:hypothetical protein